MNQYFLNGVFKESIGMAVLTLCLTGMAMAGSAADTIGYWRFEGIGEKFLADASGNGRDLRSEKFGTTEEDPKPYSLPAKGTGSAFANAENKSAVLFPEQQRNDLVTAKNPVLNQQQFTIEALVGRSQAPQNATASIIAGMGPIAKGGGGWAVMATNALSPRGVGHLIFQYQHAPGEWASETVVAADSEIVLDEGKDYYVAVAFNAADPSEDGLIFYVKDLTNNGPLQVVKKAHPESALSVNESGDCFHVGAAFLSANRWEGIIDEVRLSGKQLPRTDLLISKRPSR